MTTVGATLPPLTAKEKPPINVVGDVGGKIAIMVDDMIDDVQSFVDAALVLKVNICLMKMSFVSKYWIGDSSINC